VKSEVKSIVFPNELYGSKIEKQCSWPSKVPGITNYFELKRGMSCSYPGFARKFDNAIENL